jgi:hypothetical protein
MTIRGRITHPCCIVDVCKMSYFYSYFLVMVAWGDLLLQYVDLTNCTFKSRWVVNGGFSMDIVSRMQSMSSCSLVGHLHLGR